MDEKHFFSEAPASVNFFGVSEKGWNLQFTLRAADETTLLSRLAAFVKQLEAIHVTPKAVGRQPDVPLPVTAAPQQTPGLAQIAAPATPKAAPVAHPAATTPEPAGDLHFETAFLTGSINAGKSYWKIRGGKYTKHGVTVWPEVLATAFDLASLEAGAEYEIPGFVAHYSLNEKGQPDKVWKLEEKA